MDQRKTEQNLGFLGREVLTQVTAQPGFCAIQNITGRQTGEGIVGTVRAGRASMDAAEAAGARRQQAPRQQ